MVTNCDSESQTCANSTSHEPLERNVAHSAGLPKAIGMSTAEQYMVMTNEQKQCSTEGLDLLTKDINKILFTICCFFFNS